MYIVKFEDEEALMTIDATSFKVNPMNELVVFKDIKGEEVALLQMEKIRGIFKEGSFNVKS